VRAFGPEPVTPETLAAVLSAVAAAPTAGNLQAFRIKVITDAALLRRLSEAAYGQGFIAGAPVVLVFFSDPEASAASYGPRGQALYATQDATIACLTAHYACTDAGLGSTWVGAFDPVAVARLCAAPPTLEPVALLALGWPAESPSATPRKSLDRLLL
jgi:nitroreductase